MNEIVVLIPALNACHTIAEVIFKSKEYATTVVVCDDGSTDSTGYIAEKCGAIVLKHDKNSGKGCALRTLFDYAKTLPFKDPILVTIDSDMQHDPRDIPRLVNPILNNDVDVVIGARRRGSMPRHRRMMNWLLDKMVSPDGLKEKTRRELALYRLFAKNKLQEIQSGFRAYRFSTIKDLQIEQDGFAADTEIIQKLTGARIQNVEIETRTDEFSHTKDPVSHFMEVFNFIFLKRPLLNLGGLGIIGFLIGIYEVWRVVVIWNDAKSLALGTMLLSMLLIMLSALSFLVGVILHVINTRLKTQR